MVLLVKVTVPAEMPAPPVSAVLPLTVLLVRVAAPAEMPPPLVLA